MKKTTLFLILPFILLTGCIANDGENGLNSLILTSTEAPGANCSTGGLKVNSGLDTNANGTLDTDEFLTTNYICSGVNSLINIADELAEGTCLNGGIRIETGADSNGNGTLDLEEIQITRFLCNANNGSFDEQIRLNFGLSSSGTIANTNSGNLVGEIPNFNKNFWVGVDSIVLIAKIGYFNLPTTSFAEVFDKTNNSIIQNSLISSDEIWNHNTAEFLYSENMFDFIPNEEINLSILLRSETDGRTAFIENPAYLFLYRSN
jgi:hypothetical protein